MIESLEKSVLIKDIMTSPVVSVTLNQTVSHVLKLANDNNITGLPVIDIDRKVIGIVSTLDLITQIAVGKLHLRLGELPLNIKVEKHVICLRPDTLIKDAILSLIKKRVGRIVITDVDNKLCGIVSRKDLLNFFIAKNNIK